MIFATVVKNDPVGLHQTYQSILTAMSRGLSITRWVIKLSGPYDSSLASINSLPSFCVVLRSEDSGIYDAMNQAIEELSLEPPSSWVCFLNAGDTLHSDFSTRAVGLIRCREELASMIIGSAITSDGRKVIPIQSIVGKGGLNFCHQACLFRLRVLRMRSFPTRFRIAGDYSHFISVMSEPIRFVDATLCIYDAGGISEKSVLATRLDNFRAGYSARGVREVVLLLTMLYVRGIMRFKEALRKMKPC